MKNYTKLLLFVCAYASVLSALAQAPTDYVGYWPLDGNADDQSGNNFHGTVYGAVLANDKEGNPNSAYYLDGGNDYIDVGDIDFGNAITISGWAKLDDLNSSYTLVGKMGNDFILYFNASQQRWEGVVNTSNNSIGVTTGVNSAKAGVWQHIALTYDGNALSIFLNGSLLDSRPLVGNLNNDNTPIALGVQSGNETSMDLQGSIDDIMLFGRALSQAEIMAVYEEQKVQPASQAPTDYVGYWPLDGNADDQSGNNFHGTVYGAVLANDKEGNPNSAYYLDGGNDYIDVGDIDFGNAITISGWAKLDDLNSDYTLVGKMGNDFILYFNASQQTWEGVVNISGSQIDVTTGVNSAKAGVWQHIALTYDGNALSIFLNGSLLDSRPLVGNLNNDNTPIAFGVIASNNTSMDLRGSIDDIMLFGRALSQAEIMAVYDGHLAPPPVQTESLWSQNDTTNIYYEGKVSIGTEIVPAGFDFAINGKMMTKEVKVTIDGWADFVFENDYELPPIEKVERHIKEKGHLPEIPTESEVIANGYELGEMDAKLLQKIEELTLYLIEQDKKQEKQKQEIEALRQEINTLKNFKN